jgi:hypothetical protein
MKIYRYQPNGDQFESFLHEPNIQIILEQFTSGASLYEDWKPISLTTSSSDVREKGYFPALCDWVPVFSELACAILKPYLKESVEFLPCATEQNERHFLVNILSIVNCLDKEKSDIIYNPVTNRVSSIRSYCFNEACIDTMIFKIPETLGLEVYVTDKFKNLVENNNLSGLLFEELWSN